MTYVIIDYTRCEKNTASISDVNHTKMLISELVFFLQAVWNMAVDFLGSKFDYYITVQMSTLGSTVLCGLL